MILGLLIIIFLFLGLPDSLDKILAVIVGLLVIFVAYRMPPESRRQSGPMPYVEHRSNDSREEPRI